MSGLGCWSGTGCRGGDDVDFIMSALLYGLLVGLVVSLFR